MLALEPMFSLGKGDVDIAKDGYTYITRDGSNNLSFTDAVTGTKTLAELWAHTNPAGSNTQIQFNNSGSFGADANFVWDSTFERVGIGTGSPNSSIEIQSSTSWAAQILLKSANSSGRSLLDFYQARGNIGTPTAILANDVIGGFRFYGYDDAGYDFAGSMYLRSTENWTATNHGTDIAFATIANGSTTSSEVVWITGSGRLGIGTDSPGGDLGFGTASVYITRNGNDLEFTDITTGTKTLAELAAQTDNLTDLTDVSSATTTSGNILIANGSTFASQDVGGAIELSSTGAATFNSTASTFSDDADLIVIYDNSAGSYRRQTRANFLNGLALADLSDVSNATDTPGNILIADGTGWDSNTVSGAITITASGITAITSTESTVSNDSDYLLIYDLSAGGYRRQTRGNFLSGYGVSQLSDLPDVNTSTPTAGNLFVADGVDWESVTATGFVNIGSNGYFGFTTDTSTEGADADYLVIYDGSAGGYRRITRSNLLIGTDTPPGGSDGQIQYNNGGSFGGDASLVWDDGNKRLGIGASSPTYAIDVAGDNFQASTIGITRYNTSAAAGPYLLFRRSGNGTIGSHTAVGTSDYLGIIDFQGSNGTDFVPGGLIFGEATQTWSGTARGTDIVFQQAEDDTATLAETFRFTNDGRIVAIKGTGEDGEAAVNVGGYLLQNASFQATRWNVSYPAYLRLRRSNSDTPGTDAALGSGDFVGNIEFHGNDGVGFYKQASIECATSQAWTTSNHGMGLKFYVTPNDSTSLGLVLDISDGEADFNQCNITQSGQGVTWASLVKHSFNIAGSNSLAHGYLRFIKANGTSSVPTAVTSGDYLGAVLFTGYHASGSYTDDSSGAFLRALASENWSSSAKGTHMILGARADGTTNTYHTFKITGDGHYLFGGSNDPSGTEYLMELVGDSGTNNAIRLFRWDSSSSSGAHLMLGKSDSNTPGSYSAIDASEQLGDIYFYGDDGSGMDSAALIRVHATQNWGSLAHGSSMRFYTCPEDTVSIQTGICLDHTGYTGFGTTSPITRIHAVGDSYEASSERLSRYSADNGPAYLVFDKARGTEGSPSAVLANDYLGQIQFSGWDGSTMNGGAIFRAKATQNWSGTGKGNELHFYNCANNSTSNQLSMKIEQDGVVWMPFVATNSISAGNQVYISTSGELADNVTSSLRYKKDVEDIGDVSWLYDLGVKKFRYKNQIDDSIYYGFIAEEVDQYDKSIVVYEKGGEQRPNGLRYDRFIPLAVKGIQENKSRYDTLKEEYDQLKLRVEQLETEMAEVRA